MPMHETKLQRAMLEKIIERGITVECESIKTRSYCFDVGFVRLCPLQSSSRRPDGDR
jgi:hypothetical protein